MASLNKVFLIGNMTKNPEIRYSPAGTAVCEFSIAMNRKYKDNAGQEHDEPCFVDVFVFGKTGESIMRYTQKGSSVFVEGRLVYEPWEDKHTGAKRSRLRVNADRVQFLDRRESSQAGE